eukprot:jgi/Chlat1/3387/Chrsp23S03725
MSAGSGAKPALKKKPKPLKTSSVKWDEGNLQYNDEHRTATQKITEPKTPYRPPLNGDGHITPQDGDSDSEEIEAHGAALHRAVSDAADWQQQQRAAGEASSSGWDSDEEDVQGVGGGGGTALPTSNGESAPELEAKHAQFVAMRKKHYDEFLAAKRAREQHLASERPKKLIENCLDEDEDASENGVSGSKRTGVQ